MLNVSVLPPLDGGSARGPIVTPHARPRIDRAATVGRRRRTHGVGLHRVCRSPTQQRARRTRVGPYETNPGSDLLSHTLVRMQLASLKARLAPRSGGSRRWLGMRRSDANGVLTTKKPDANASGWKNIMP